MRIFATKSQKIGQNGPKFHVICASFKKYATTASGGRNLYELCQYNESFVVISYVNTMHLLWLLGCPIDSKDIGGVFEGL